MAKIEELEALLQAKEGQVVEDDDDGGYEDLVEQDMEEAISLLSKCMHVLDYLSDPDLVRTVSKRERQTMAKVSEKVRNFLDEVEPHYREE